MKIFLSLTLAVFLFLSSAGIVAQNLSESIQEDVHLKKLLEKVDSLAIVETKKNIYPESISEAPISSAYHVLKALSFSEKSYYGPLLLEVTAEKQAAEDDIGISFRAGYRENIEEGVFSSGDVFYLRRFNAGFQWDFLSGGWFDSHKRVEELEVREKMVERTINIQQANEKYERIYNRLIYLFNLQKVNVIHDYLALLNSNMELIQRLHYLDYEPWERVLELSEQKARLQNNLDSYREYNDQIEETIPDSLIQHIEQLKAAKLPLLQLEIDLLAAANDMAFARRSLTNDDLKKLDYNFFRDISLSAFADYNIYDVTGNALDPDRLGGREYFSVGVNLSIPLPINSSEKKKMVEERKLRYINTQKSEHYSEQKELNNNYYEYRYKIQQFIQLYKDFLSRQETIDEYTTLKSLEDPAFSTQRLTHILLQRYAVVLEMIDLKQQMYLQLINMDKYLTDQSILEFADILDVSNLFPYKSVQAGGIYIWSETFADNSNKVLLSFLKNFNVNRIYLSLGPDDSLLKKASRFISATRQEGIDSQLLVGNNGLIRSENQQVELEMLVKQAEELGFSGIHLDVEPHTFDDWDSRRTHYEQSYISMLENASEISTVNNMPLSVSIPHFYDSMLPDLKQSSDKVVVMVYETQDIEIFKQRIEEEKLVLGEKLQVAIRPSDFSNFDDLNRFVQQIVSQTGVQDVILHDAGSLLNIVNRIR